MATIRATAKTLALLSAALACGHLGGAAADDGAVSLDVLGSVTGSLGGEEREWLTIAGEPGTQRHASASWRRSEMEMPDMSQLQSQIMGAMGRELSAEELRQMEQMGEMMSGEGPMADVLGQMMGGAGMTREPPIRLTISGHDPASPNILTEQVLIIDVSLPGGAEAALSAEAVPAEIAYYAEHSGGFVPDVFYVSGEEAQAGQVVFERLELAPDGGHAAGRFEAELCRMEGARLNEGPDPTDCRSVNGQFDTKLVAE